MQAYCPIDRTCHESCKYIRDTYPEARSGTYCIKNAKGKGINVYCNMERECGGTTGGWMRVADIDMRRSSNTCPSGLKTLRVSSKRLCSMSISGGGCSSATLSVQNLRYSQVCGKIIGYQQKSPDAFLPYRRNSRLTIDDGYVDGIILTHGHTPRKHIWTFAAALHEHYSWWHNVCPCTNRNNPDNNPVPPFIGNQYFCDTGSSNHWQLTFYRDDPLWDGHGCGSKSTCCSLNSPPWFCTQLPQPTTDDIEIRLCADQDRGDEDITFEQIELYVM